jgi:hypothetical protein
MGIEQRSPFLEDVKALPSVASHSRTLQTPQQTWSTLNSECYTDPARAPVCEGKLVPCEGWERTEDNVQNLSQCAGETGKE